MNAKWRFVAIFALSFVASMVLLSQTKTEALNQSFYIDCSASVNGTGTQLNPWNTPKSLYDRQRPPGAYTFGANDRVYIRSGTTCNYPIRMIRGSGTDGSPVVITSYDSGPRPIINGSLVQVDNWDGQPDSSAVLLRDFDNVTVENLELTNTGGDDMDGRRQGVWVFTSDKYGARRNITIRNNYIHDIWGEYMKNREATAAINVEQRVPPTGVDPTPDPTWYENILIEDNVLERSHHQGISFWGDWRNRPEDGYNISGPAWTGWTNVVIQDNEIYDMRGDGILLTNTEGAIIQRNIVKGFNQLNSLPESEILAILNDAKVKQGLTNYPSRNHAGMFSYNTNNSIFQFNDVREGISNRDGMAYDIDGGSIGTIFQYNYSQDNEGGFGNICGELGQIRDGIYRYNISKNDGFATITVCVGEILNTKVYNNTFYTTNPLFEYPYYEVDWLRGGGDPMLDTKEIDFTNNIFYYPENDLEHFFFNFREGEGIIEDQSAADVTANNNIYQGVNVPARDSDPLNSKPYFKDINDEADGFILFKESVGVGSGVAVSNDGSRDYFGTTLSSPYNIGAVHSTAVDGDSVDDDTEKLAPNNGDGNNDGVPDVMQSNVASMVNPVTGQYVTLQVLDAGQVAGDQSTKCTSIEALNINSKSSLGLADSNQYPIGIINFELDCTSPGDGAVVTFFLDKKYDHGNWEVGKIGTKFTLINNSTISLSMIGSSEVSTFSYTVSDGGVLDQDLTANGRIVDPVGPAVLAESTLLNTGTGTIVPFIFGSTLITTALALNRRYELYRHATYRP